MKKFLSFFLMFTFISSAWGGNLLWRINRDHSEILFEVDYLEIASIQGRFQKFKGEVTFDKDLVLINKIKIVIDSSSIYTGNKMRDNHLRSASFFNSDQFSSITFESTDIKAVAPHEFITRGKLKIKKNVKFISFTFKISDLKNDTWGYQNKFVTFSGSLKRHNFGLEWEKTLAEGKFLVGDEIKLKGQFQIQPFNRLTPASKHMIPDTEIIRRRERGETVISISENFNNSLPLENVENKEGKKDAILKSDIKVFEACAKEEIQPFWWVTYVASCLLSVAGLFLFTPIGKKIFKSLRAETIKEEKELNRLLIFLAYPMLTIYIVTMLYVGFGQR